MQNMKNLLINYKSDKSFYYFFESQFRPVLLERPNEWNQQSTRYLCRKTGKIRYHPTKNLFLKSTEAKQTEPKI